MSDDIKNLIIDYGKECGKGGILGTANIYGDKLLDKIKTTYRLKTSTKPFSIKLYKGWKGNQYTKVYKLSHLAKRSLGAVINSAETAYNLFKHGIKSKEFVGSLFSSIGSIIAGGAAGMALGSFCPGIGNIAGFIIGVGASAIGAIGGQYVGENLHDRVSGLKDGGNIEIDDIPQDDNNDLTGGGETGGVEFEIPHEIKGFKQLLFFNNLQNQSILFKNEFSNINEILNVANRFTINNIKFNSIEQIFQTILTEIYGGFIGEGILPYVSLNFNNKSLLYSIMPNYYKKTLVGNILGYLDYFLKGFVNGGFFKEDFAGKWYINQNENYDYLNSNFINLKKYIYKNRHDIKNHELYLTVYDLGENICQDNSFRKNSLSAFRIIGTISNDILVNNNIIIPNCSFRTESDFNLFPEYFNEIKPEGDKEISKTQEAIKSMKAIIKIMMPQIPYFRGYFHILDMITFSIHYISTLDSNAIYPDLSESLLFKSNNKSYVSLLPPVFPPLPIKRQNIINIDLSFSYVIKYFLNEQQRNILNSILSDCVLNDSEIDYEKIEEILNVLESKYKNHLFNLIQDKENIEYRTKRELHIDEYLNNIQTFLNILIKAPKVLFSQLFKSIEKSLKKIIQGDNIHFNLKYEIKAKNIDNIQNISGIKKELLILIEDFNNVAYQIKNNSKNMIEDSIKKEKNKIFNEINKNKEIAYRDNEKKLNHEISEVKSKSISESISQMEQNLKSEKEKALQKIPYYNRNEASNKIDNEIEKLKQENVKKITENIENHFETIKQQKLIELRNNLEIKTKELFQEALRDLDNDKKKKEKFLNDSIIELEKYIKEEKVKMLDIENTIKNKQILKYVEILDKQLLVEKINLSLIGYYENNNNDKNISFAPIRGGCLPEINNELTLKDSSQSQIEELNSLISKVNQIQNSGEISNKGIRFTKININLLQGHLNEYFCQNFMNFNGASERAIIDSIQKDENITIKDEYNNTTGIYKILMGNSEKITNKNEIRGKNLFEENSSYYLINDEDVDKILSLGEKSILSVETRNDLNCFLISLIRQNRELSNSLVEYIPPSMINSSNESKYTPFHFACLYNYYELVDSLIKKGAKINSKTRNSNYTPIDILIIKGNYEILELILKNKEFINIINEKNHFNSTPFHSSCLESILCTKLMLKHRNRIKDLNGNTPEHYAFLGGRIDIYNLITSSDIKEFNEYINFLRAGDKENLNEKTIITLENENNFLNCLLDNLKKGNISDVIKIIKFYQKNKNIKKKLLFGDITGKIVDNMCKGRNPLMLAIISEIIDLHEFPLSSFIGKYGLISFIEEMKNMNINMFTEIDSKSLLDFAIENKDEEMILEFFKNLEEITDDYFSKYLTKILKKSFDLFNSIYNYILSQEKFSKNKINFDYLYNKDSLPEHFRIFFNLEKIDKDSLDLNKIKQNCRDSVISEVNNHNYKIIKELDENKYDVEKTIFKKLLEKNSSSKYNFYLFEHDKQKLIEIFKKLSDYNLFLPHQIIKSKKIWMLKYLPKNHDLFIKNDMGELCFELIQEEFDNYILLLEIFMKRENKKQLQMYYFLKVIEIILGKFIKKDKEHQLEIILKKKIMSLIECFEKNKEYLSYYQNDRNNNLLHIISNTYYMDKELKDKYLSFIELIRNNNSEKEFIKILNGQNIFGNTFLFILLNNNHHKLSIEILDKYFKYFDLSIRNFKGNNFLHYLMSIKYYDKRMMNIILKVIEYNKFFIISENNNGLTPFHLAALNKCKDSIFIMSNYFSFEQLEIISNKGSLLHYAAISDSLSTLRLLVEMFKCDINSQIHNKINNNKNKKHISNLPNKSTPIYCAGLFSCLNSFEYLLSLGADPFIQDENGNDAIDMALINGNEKMISFISKTHSFINSNGKYLLSLVKNIHARHILYNNFYFLGVHNINIINKYQQNLLMLAVENKNHRIVPFLLSNFINVENFDIFGRNILHYSINVNNLTSIWIILSHLNNLNKNEIIYNLIFKPDNNDESALYLASKLGRLEIVYFMLYFIGINNFAKKLNINFIGLSPIHISILNGHYTISLLLKEYFNISDNEINNISEEYKNKINLFFNCNLEKEKKKLTEVMLYLNKQNEIYKKNSSIIDKEKISELNENEEIYNIKTYYIFNKMFPNCLSNKQFIKYKDLFSVNFIFFLCELNFNEKYTMHVKRFFEILSSINYNGNIKESAQYKLLTLFTTYIIPSEYYKLSQINEYLYQILSNDKLLNLNISHPIFYWIDSIIISFCEGKIKSGIEDLLDILLKFINIILSKNEFLNNLNFVKLSMKSYQFIDNLNNILSKLNKDFAIIQLKYLHCIPPLLENEVNALLKQYSIIHQDYNNRIPIYLFIKEILAKKDISPQLLESCLIISESIIKSNQINYKAKEEILSFCRYIYNNYINDNNLPNTILSISSISENLCYKFGLDFYSNEFLNTVKKLKIKNLIDLKNIFNAFLQVENLEHFKQFCDILKRFSLSQFFEKIKIIKNEKKGRNINELLKAFKEEQFPLSEEEIIQLELFEKEFERQREYIQTEFIEEGKNLGRKFKENPTIENFAKIIKIVNCGIIEILKMKPYLIQNLIVFSFYLHYINKQKRNFYKGRLGQILTGEGKSLIIAEIALISALMGEFVDIITSTAYLAKRDQIKFKELYKSFGVSSNSITESNPSKETFNGIILYGTNTDFEFTLLREGINIEKKMFTIPLDEKVEVRREFQTVIVDESDNLFIDTALNSARIAYSSRNHFNWVYYPILNCVKNNISGIEEIRKKLEIINYKESKIITDCQLESWIEKAITSLEYKKGEKYIVRYNEEKRKKEVQIIQLSTGRVNIGSRWMGGLHEFLEVKEGLEPETESNTIASISHPSFFRNYKTIFGLTGTIGSEIEREEILNIYNLDSFNVPPNFSSQRKIYETLLFSNKSLKEENIINQIRNIISKGRPVLVLVLTIEDSINLSNRLKKEGINNLILNDIQKEKEEYIIFYAGKPQSVVVATNAAGRGTDIILSEESLNFGGLHVIMGFYPENTRVEFQGIGRAGRQGQIGSAQVIFSKDEKYFSNVNINSVNDAEHYRMSKLKKDSEIRFISSLFEMGIYEILKIFFNKLYDLKKILETENFQIIFNDTVQNKNINYFLFSQKIIEKFKEDWAEYFNKISERNTNIKSSFNEFLKLYEWEMIDHNFSDNCTELISKKIKSI